MATKEKIIGNKTQELPKVFFILAYLSAALCLSLAHDWFIDSRLNDVRETLHQQVMAGNAPAPIQYRVMVYYAAQSLMDLGISLQYSYFLIRFVFLFLSGLAFHFFLRSFFSSIISFAGVMGLFSLIPLTFLHYYMQPMDIPNLFFFLAGCILIINRKDLLLYPLLFIAMFNRETAILLVFVYMFVRFDELPLGKYLFNSVLLTAVGMGTYVALRKIFAIKHYYSDMFYLDYNLTSPLVWLYAAALFAPFIYFAFKGFSNKPKFLRRAILITPIFLVIHYTMTIMAEPRLWMPLLPLFISAAFWTLMPEDQKTAQQLSPFVKNIISKTPVTFYIILLAVFIGFFAWFYSYYQKIHLADRNVQLQVKSVLYDAMSFSSNGWFKKAEEEYKKAIALDPKNDTAEYELGMLYAYSLYDMPKALECLEKTLALNPYHFENKRIKAEISRLKYYISNN